jgi:hypothetical protein
MGCHVAPDWHAGDVAPGGQDWGASEEVPLPEWGGRNRPAIQAGALFSGKGKTMSGSHRQGAAGRQAVPGYPDAVVRQGDRGTKAGDGTAA